MRMMDGSASPARRSRCGRSRDLPDRTWGEASTVGRSLGRPKALLVWFQRFDPWVILLPRADEEPEVSTEKKITASEAERCTLPVTVLCGADRRRPGPLVRETPS